MASPLSSPASDAAIDPPVQTDPVSPAVSEPATRGQRLHALDGLRAVALLLGLVLHSTMPYVVTPGRWAVGTTEPVLLLGWLAYYLHCFRLEVFFLLAGFFGALVVEKRGTAWWVKDRAVRILLVFLVALLPMKIVLSAVWIRGGLVTGWLEIPEPFASLPLWKLAVGALFEERWPAISITHLWFLYYLSILSAFWAAVHLLVRRMGVLAALATQGQGVVRRVLSSRLAPLWLALVTTPILSQMSGVDADIPERSLAWHLPLLALYGFFFAIGWTLDGARELLTGLAARGAHLLIGGLGVSAIAAIGVALRQYGDPWDLANADALRWGTSFGTSLAMAMSVLGWIGAFIRFLDRPSPSLRYLADASYWIYIVHLPVMVALQVWWSGSGLPWGVQVPLVNLVTLAVTLASYQLFVRSTWIGGWLNGVRR